MERKETHQTEPMIDSRTAAEILQVSSKTVERMAIRKQIPAMKVGKLWRFRASVLDEWVNRQLNSSRHPHLVSEGK